LVIRKINADDGCSSFSMHTGGFMLSQDENRLLCEIESDAPMHDVFKRYWWPIALTSDIREPDSDPHRVTLLGEDYVLFRDNGGQLGLVRERCCHRGASLMLGHVENGGIRCIYHGWKFAADGTLLDMPNCADDKFKSRYKQPAYAVREVSGLIWAYVGAAEHKPPFPHYPFMDVPDGHIWIVPMIFGGNYVQTYEGLLDSSHLGVLHADALQLAGQNSANDVGKMLSDQRAPEVEVEEAEYGLRYAAIRDVPNKNGGVDRIARVTAFQFPSTCYIAPDKIVIFSVPVNNKVTLFISIVWKWDEPFAADEIAQLSANGGTDAVGQKWGLGRDYFGKPGTGTRENNWLQDREAMRMGKTFSGLINFSPEDAAMVASQGEIYDRSWENLVPADLAIARARRVQLENMRAVQNGEPARGLAPNPPARPAMGRISADLPWSKLPYDGDAVKPVLEPVSA
jgi:phthalate 4,5-dioxygenase